MKVFMFFNSVILVIKNNALVVSEFLSTVCQAH